MLSLAGAARAAPVQGTYEVRAAGLTVLEVEAVFDLDAGPGYLLETRSRPRGVASLFSSGQLTTRTNGTWVADRARPLRHLVQGTWRGSPRSAVLDYPSGQPVLRQLVPSLEEEEREPVPPEAQRDTVDTLSAVMQLLQEVRRSGRCEAQAAVYDGRRRSELRATTVGWEALSGSGSDWSGRALHCRFEGRQTGGFRRQDDARARLPEEGAAWLAAIQPGTPAVPVRMEVPTRLFGSATVVLVRVGPPAATAGR